MTKNLFSRQEVIKLLTQLKNFRAKYPPELLAAQRRTFLILAAQLAATRLEIDSRRNHWISSIIQEPVSVIVKALIIIFFAFLLAFIAHSVTSGNIDFGWLMELLFRR